jgi:hypothetical protein
MLHDGNARREQQRVRGVVRRRRVVDVQRADTDQRRVMADQPGRAGPGQEVAPPL